MTAGEKRGAESVAPFVGREAELAGIGLLIRGGGLLTLTGAGGIGKTRLALEAVRRARKLEPREIFVAELAHTVPAGAFSTVLLAAVGGREQPGSDPLATLDARLAGRPVVLVVDSCEHLGTETTEILARLCERSQDLRIVATARQPLAIEGELVWQVPAMSTPDPDAAIPLLAVVESDAGRLFVAEAARRIPGFGLSAEMAPAIARICRELDGLPLAIELAAARVSDHSPEAIAEGLADRFPLLGDGLPSRQPAHQRSLRASLDWSCSLLNADERRLLRRCAVLNGATAADAAAVCEPSEPPDRVNRRMQSLADRGLVDIVQDPVLGANHYEMSKSVHKYALEQLAQEGEEEQLRDRHMVWFARLAGEANKLLNDPAGRRRLDLAVPNLRAALARAIAQDVPAALAICERLARYWFAADRFEEGRASCSRALAVAEEADSASRALVLWGAALLAAVVEDYAEAHLLATQGLALAEVSEDERALGLCLQITNLVLGTVDPHRAAKAGRRAVELLRVAGDGYDLGHALLTLAAAEALRDRFDAFSTLRAEFMAIPEASGDDWLRILMDLHAAWACLTQGDPRRALEHATGALEAVGEEVSMRAALARTHRLHAMARAGEAKRALHEGLGELQAARSTGSTVVALSLEMALAIVELAIGNLDAAQARAERLMDASALHAAVVWREILARIAFEREQPTRTSEHAAVIRELGGRSGSARQTALADYLDGVAALQRDAFQGATDLLHGALRTQQEHHCWRDATDTLEALALLAARRGDARRGARLHAASTAARNALGCVRVPPEGNAMSDLRAGVESRLGVELAARARAEGERLSLREAIAYAQRSRGRRGQTLEGWASLTPAEAQAAKLAATGLGNPEIAARLLMGRGTVKTHLSRAYGKLGVSNRTELAVLVGDIEHAAEVSSG